MLKNYRFPGALAALALLFAWWAAAQAPGPSADPAAPARFQVTVATSRGPFVIDVHRDWAPHGADRFFHLVQSGYFDDSRFFRVVKAHWVQFGIAGQPELAQAWRTRAIPDDPPVEPNHRGTIAFAFALANGRTTEVYINLVDNSKTQDAQGFAPFGEITSGMDVVDTLYSGYGEQSGGGIRAGKQDALFTGGNAYLDQNYPLLDKLVSARVSPSQK